MIRNWLYRLTAGRYGSDNLSRFLLILMIIPLVVSLFLRNSLASTILWFFALLVLIYSYFRMFSKNISRRQAENQKYLNIRNKIIFWFKSRKDQLRMRKEYKFFKCPSCRSCLRVPRGKGKIKITCRKCGHIFNTKT